MANRIIVEFDKIANRNDKVENLPEFKRVLTLVSNYMIGIWRPTPPGLNQNVLAVQLYGFPKIGRVSEVVILPFTDTVVNFNVKLTTGLISILCQNKINALYRNQSETDNVRGGKELIVRSRYIEDRNSSHVSFWMRRVR